MVQQVDLVAKRAERQHRPPVYAGRQVVEIGPMHELRTVRTLLSWTRMRVSELAQRTGVSTFRLRHYEQLGLIHAERTGSGYREFAERVAREVIFIAMSRDLGFSLKDIGETLPRYRARTLT